jgi:hypothetical protein
MSSTFDFSSRLKAVQPKQAPVIEAPIEQATEEVAERHEFISREPTRRIKRVRSNEPIEILSVKGPLSVMNRFKQYANDEGHASYWTALDALLKQAKR